MELPGTERGKSIIIILHNKSQISHPLLFWRKSTKQISTLVCPVLVLNLKKLMRLCLFCSLKDGFAYKKAGKMSGGQMLSQLDWDAAGENIKTSSADFNLNFWNSQTNKMEQVPSLRNKEWIEETCLVGWALAGAWSNHNYSDTVIIETAHIGSQRQLLVCGDREGFIRLFGYPSTSPKSKYHEEKDVSGPISCARFFYDDSYVIAVGGYDAALFKYKVK